jgi:Gram-negative bacterial TonB protein C-terminal
VKIAPFTYPPVARQTRISGDVEPKLEVQLDGGVASAVAVRGHPLLVQAALDNAQKSHFACEECGEETHFFRLLYTFGLDQPNDESARNQLSTSNPDHPNLRVTQSPGHVFIADHTVCLCDRGPDLVKVRPKKCLYLWKCKRVL